MLTAERLHGDDTTVPVLAKGKTITGRCWTYVRDDRPFGGRAPPAALFFYSRDRSGEHLRRILATYAVYYSEVRTHLAVDKDSPGRRPIQRLGQFVARPILGGLHHQYGRM